MEQSKVALPINGHKTAVISAENVFVRKSPESDGAIVTTLTGGTVVKVLGTMGLWLLVDADGDVGYVWSGCFEGYSGGCR